jgi:hypothetical protein
VIERHGTAAQREQWKKRAQAAEADEDAAEAAELALGPAAMIKVLSARLGALLARLGAAAEDESTPEDGAAPELADAAAPEPEDEAAPQPETLPQSEPAGAAPGPSFDLRKVCASLLYQS